MKNEMTRNMQVGEWALDQMGVSHTKIHGFKRGDYVLTERFPKDFVMLVEALEMPKEQSRFSACVGGVCEIECRLLWFWRLRYEPICLESKIKSDNSF